MNDGKNLPVHVHEKPEFSPSRSALPPLGPGRSLCAPDPLRRCFGCCPPIRPARYDPLDWVSSLKREFRENRELLTKNLTAGKPIVGFSCWALGYLDADGQLVGCLLHPARHAGRDLRHLTGYGEKCARECCLEAKHFERLSLQTQSFWLSLTEGLGSFYYSSRRANPLFHLLLWGPVILEKLAAFGRSRSLHVTELVHRFPFLFHERWKPRGHRFLMEAVLGDSKEDALVENEGIEKAAQKIHEVMCAELVRLSAVLHRPPLVHVHRSGLGDAFADYLRGIHGIFKANSLGLFQIKERAQRRVRRRMDS